jgi:hypothetical protein
VNVVPFQEGRFICGIDLPDIVRTLATGTSSSLMPPVERLDLTFIRDNLEGRLLAHRENVDPLRYPIEEAFEETELEALRGYVASLPVWRQMDQLTAREIGVAAENRRWALGAYVQSLAGIPPGTGVPESDE